jgi:hypothetical protein
MTDSPATIEEISVDDLEFDDKNPNRGTDRGRETVRNSITELGFGRSILIDRKGKIVAGNKSTEAAIKAGIKTVRVIKTTGNEIIAVQRTDLDLDSPEGRKFAVADNRSAQLGIDFDPAILSELTEAGVDLASFFTETELAKLCDGLAEEMMDYGDEEDSDIEDTAPENLKQFNIFIDQAKYQEFVDAVEFLREKQAFASASDTILTIIMREYSAG